VDLNTIGDYNDNKDKLKGITDLAILGTFTNVSGPAGGVSVYITPDLDDPGPVEIPGPPPGNATLLWGPGNIGASPSSVKVDWNESAALFNPDGKKLLIDEIKGDGTFTIYTTGTVGTYDIKVDDGFLVIVLDAGI